MYTFDTTERNNSTANEFETKSMLYLMTMREDSNKIEIFIIDCFNDVTGARQDLNELWDVQSKGVKSLNPRKIGHSLVTLFMNHLSSITFNNFILFIPKLKIGYLNDENLTIFNYQNIKQSKRDKIFLGLSEEYARRKDILIDEIDILEVNKFIEKVTFVVAFESNVEYIKKLVSFKNKDQFDDDFFISLFNEIMAMQTSIKNICIDGKCINSVNEVTKFNKILTRNQLESLVISRLVGMEVFSTKSIPIYFHKEIKDYEFEEINDLIIECNTQISKTLFNKALKSEFWEYFETVINLIKEYPHYDSIQIHKMIPNNKFDFLYTLEEIGSIYFISMVKGGFQE